MKTRSLFIFALLLTACPGTVTQRSVSAESQPLRQPVEVRSDGAIEHEPTGLAFDASYGPFERVSVLRFDTSGLDMGFGYNTRWGRCRVAATFYLYPAPRMSFVGATPEVVESLERDWLAAGLAQSREEIEHHHPALESPWTGAASTAADGGTLSGSSFKFHESGDLSELRLFVLRHQWFLKYRFTYPEACQSQAEARIAELVAQMPWAAPR